MTLKEFLNETETPASASEWFATDGFDLIDDKTLAQELMELTPQGSKVVLKFLQKHKSDFPPVLFKKLTQKAKFLR